MASTNSSLLIFQRPLMSSRLATSLRGALLAARAAGHARVTVDGTLIRTDRCHTPGPTARSDRTNARVDLWWSGKHMAHGGNIRHRRARRLADQADLHSPTTRSPRSHRR
jgi:hypothetical protein